MRPGPAVTLMAGVFLAACSTAPTPAADPSVASLEPAATGSRAPATAPPSPTATTTDAPLEPAWTLISDGGTAPPAREDHTWTAAPDGVAYLFGGRDGATSHADLWKYDLASGTWTLIEAAGPPARFGHNAAWVDRIGLVIFAGQAGATFFDDLWAYDPSAGMWRQLRAGGAAPTPRYGSCAALGPDGRLWISHGFTADGTRFADTRAYDFAAASWADVTPEGSPPVARCLHGCWWTDDGRLELYGGQTTGVTALGDRWTLDPGAGWARVDGEQPPDRNLYAAARWDGGTVVFGGQSVDGGHLADAWLLDDGGGTRSMAAAGPGPAPRAGAELVADPERGRLLLFGGRAASVHFGDVWQLTIAVEPG